MSAWRRQLLEQFPDIASGDHSTIQSLYLSFAWLVKRAVEAHAVRDIDTFRKIHGFAAMCARSPNSDLWNPAGVSFYEHLPDHESTRQSIVEWVPPDVFANVACLIEAKMAPAPFAELVRAYERKYGKSGVRK